MRISKRLTLCCLAAGFVTSACNKDKLAPLVEFARVRGSVGNATINFCTDLPEALPYEKDYFFVVDTSNSNQQNCATLGSQANCVINANQVVCQNGNNFTCVTPLIPEAGTNPNGDLSFGVINSFLNAVSQIDPGDPNVFFSLIEYNTAPWQVQGLTNSLTQFQGVVQQEWNAHNFGGWTDLTATLNVVMDQIHNGLNGIVDLEAKKLVPTRHEIEIILIGNGVPQIFDSSTNSIFIEPTAGLVQQVVNLENLAQTYPQFIRSLTVNTLYDYITNAGYSSYNPFGVQLFQQLATAGSGSFYNAGNGQIPNFDAFIIPTISNPYKLTDLVVHDMNTAWTPNTLDTATDGLMSDTYRISKGAPAALVATGNPDSDGNGVKDLVEYFLTGGQICNDPNCAPQAATQYQNGVCGAFVVNGTPGQVSFTQTLMPQSIFNDCELTLLHADTSSALIPGTDVPEEVAAVMFYPIAVQGSTSWLWSSPFNDGFTSYQHIKYNADPLINMASVVGFKSYDYTLQYLGQNPGPQDCYRATVNNITLSLLPNDMIRVELVETGVQSSTSKVRTGAKKADVNGNVTFFDGDLL
jgi:hypothetical protein